MRVYAPFTLAFVEYLHHYQMDDFNHSYTCPGDFPECKDQRKLTPTADGWVCKCGKYTQNWAHG